MSEIDWQFEELKSAEATVSNLNIQPEYSNWAQLPTKQDISSTHLPDMSIYDKSHASLISKDGPGQVLDDSLNGQNPRQEPAEAGNAHHTVELIQSGRFQNADGTLTAAARESIAAAVRNAGAFPNVFQSFEARTQEVQDYINQHVFPPISLRFDRDEANANTLTGSRPFIVFGDNQRIPLR